MKTMAERAGVLADLDPPRIGHPGPNPLADLDRGVQIRGGSKSAVTPVLTTLTLRTTAPARKRMIQTLNDKDIPPSQKMQLSGHKNVQSINNYSHVSQEQQKRMSRISSGSTSMVQTETHSFVETRKYQSPTPTAAGLFKGAVFYGGNFTININSSSSSTTDINNKLVNLRTTMTVYL